MPVSVYSSMPRVNFRGIADESTVNLTMPAESLPIRLPLFMTFAPWGDEKKANYVDAAAVNLLYGADTLNAKSKFFTHQNLFLRTQLTAGGKALLLRVAPEDATQASARLALDMVADALPVYERNLDGSYKLDANGDKIATGDTVDGYRLQWRLLQVPTGEQGFGLGAPGAGTMVSAATGDTSVITPINDALARHRGARGNDIGYRLIAPTVASREPADPDLLDRVGSAIYRLQIVERASATSTATLKRTLTGTSYVDFSFVKGAIDPETQVQYYADTVVPRSYESRDPTAFTGYGPFERIHTYDAAVASILETLKAAEEAATGEEIANANLINFLTGVDVNGIPYHSFVVEGPSLGGLLFSEAANHYMKGGSDGTVNTATYNQLIDALLDSLESSEIPFTDIARMPYDSVWDTGFPVSTKKKFANFHAIRPDVLVHGCTQDVSLALNTPSQDASIGITLRSTFRAMQESSEFGTKALRFALVMGAGYLINDDYEGMVPMLEWLCMKGGEYMGAENGEMNSSFSFGRGEQNIVTRYRDHNAGWKPDEARNSDWTNGLNYTEWYDMNRLFFAGIQSIYENQTSVLHSYINTQIACNLTRIGHIVWREMSGDSQLTDDQFLDMVNDKVTARTNGKYDNRVNITPNAYYSALDEDLGFSWHLNIGMEGDNIRTVENLAIISQRRRNEEAA